MVRWFVKNAFSLAYNGLEIFATNRRMFQWKGKVTSEAMQHVTKKGVNIRSMQYIFIGATGLILSRIIFQGMILGKASITWNVASGGKNLSLAISNMK